MTSVQENKNELEAAVRYCESAISRAKQTIESMEFRQQAASKAWHEQTGRESALEYTVNDLKLKYDKMKDYADKLLDENVEVDERNEELNAQVVDLKVELDKLRSEKEASSAPCGCQAYRDLEEDRGRAEGEVELLQREIATLNDQIEELGKAYNNEVHETNVWKKAHQEQRELVALRDDQIAMLERKLAKKND